MKFIDESYQYTIQIPNVSIRVQAALLAMDFVIDVQDLDTDMIRVWTNKPAKAAISKIIRTYH